MVTAAPNTVTFWPFLTLPFFKALPLLVTKTVFLATLAALPVTFTALTYWFLPTL